MGACLGAKSCGPLEAKAVRSMIGLHPSEWRHLRSACLTKRPADTARCDDRQELFSLSGRDPSF